MNEIITEQQQLETRAEAVKRVALNLQVVDKDSYEYAVGYLRNIKDSIKMIEIYWADPKKKAHEAWKAITSKESDMKKPLEEAEKAVKRQMSDYVRIQEDERRRAEKEAKKATGISVALTTDVPLAKGVSYITDYEVSVEDITKVPLLIAGVQILQVDISAIKALVKAAKGKIEIPGIKIEETKRVSMR